MRRDHRLRAFLRVRFTEAVIDGLLVGLVFGFLLGLGVAHALAMDEAVAAWTVTARGGR